MLPLPPVSDFREAVLPKNSCTYMGPQADAARDDRRFRGIEFSETLPKFVEGNILSAGNSGQWRALHLG